MILICDPPPCSHLFPHTSSSWDELRKEEGVGVMKVKEVNLEETEASLTLGGSEEGRVQGGEREGDR